jgi:hypothetical protein
MMISRSNKKEEEEMNRKIKVLNLALIPCKENKIKIYSYI